MLYEIDEAEIGVLDECEGFRLGRPRGENAYERVEIEVWTTGTHVSPQRVWTYVVVRKLDPCPRPSAEYKRLMVDGARHWGFPAGYLERSRPSRFNDSTGARHFALQVRSFVDSAGRIRVTSTGDHDCESAVCRAFEQIRAGFHRMILEGL